MANVFENLTFNVQTFLNTPKCQGKWASFDEAEGIIVGGKDGCLLTSLLKGFGFTIACELKKGRKYIGQTYELVFRSPSGHRFVLDADGIFGELEDYARFLGVTNFKVLDIIQDYDDEGRAHTYVRAIDKVWELIEALPNKVGALPESPKQVIQQVVELVK